MFFRTKCSIHILISFHIKVTIDQKEVHSGCISRVEIEDYKACSCVRANIDHRIARNRLNLFQGYAYTVEGPFYLLKMPKIVQKGFVQKNRFLCFMGGAKTVQKGVQKGSSTVYFRL